MNPTEKIATERKIAKGRKIRSLLGSVLIIGVMGAMALGQSVAATRYDSQIQTAVARKLASKHQFRAVSASVEDGIVTLAGTVDLYQRKLDAAKVARKTANLQGVRNLIVVVGASVPDAELEQKLATKLTYVREGFDNEFDYFALGVKDGVVTVEGQDRTGIGRDEALADIANMPGVKDVINNISVEPVSNFDDRIRLNTARTIYRDPMLGRYAADPARPIRIVVANGHVTLYGVVNSAMDKQIAGMKAAQVPGVFGVENKLEVESKG